MIEILGSTLDIGSVSRERWLNIWILRRPRHSSMTKGVLGIGNCQTVFQHPVVVTYNRRKLGMKIQ